METGKLIAALAVTSLNPGAVNGGANTVRNFNSADAREISCEPEIDYMILFGSCFQAITSVSAVLGGSSSVVDILNSFAATVRNTPPLPKVAKARCQVNFHSMTWYRGFNVQHGGSYQYA